MAFEWLYKTWRTMKPRAVIKAALKIHGDTDDDFEPALSLEELRKMAQFGIDELDPPIALQSDPSAQSASKRTSDRR